MFVGVRTDGGEVLYLSNSESLPSARADCDHGSPAPSGASAGV